jgi:hypothetical protein
MLRRTERADDFRINCRPRPSLVAIIAPHGGKVEPGTSTIAAAIAADDCCLYRCEGRKRNITSTHFDEPECLALISCSELLVRLNEPSRLNENRGARATATLGIYEEAARPANGISFAVMGLGFSPFARKFSLLWTREFCRQRLNFPPKPDAPWLSRAQSQRFFYGFITKPIRQQICKPIANATFLNRSPQSQNRISGIAPSADIPSAALMSQNDPTRTSRRDTEGPIARALGAAFEAERDKKGISFPS